MSSRLCSLLYKAIPTFKMPRSLVLRTKIPWRTFYGNSFSSKIGLSKVKAVEQQLSNDARIARSLGLNRSIAGGGILVGLGIFSTTCLVLKRTHFQTACCEEHSTLRQQNVRKENEKLLVKSKNESKWEGMKKMLRLAQITCLFFPVMILFPFTIIIPERLSDGEWWRSLLVYTMQIGGPMFVKLGQWACTRADLFSPKLRSSFSVLQRNCSLEPIEQTIATVKSDLQISRLEEYFEEFSIVPLGAGVIAQVHHATLKDTGEEVAVKIRRHNIVKVLNRDLELLKGVAHLITVVLPKHSQPFSISETVNQFSEFMVEQLDLRIEGSNLDNFNMKFENKEYDLQRIKFPKKIQTSRNGAVLIESFEKGELLSDLLEKERKGVPSALDNENFRKSLAKLGLEAFLKMVLVDNFCHSDLHPGNILVRYQSGYKDEPILNNGASYDSIQLEGLTFIDAGLVTTLSENDQKNFIDLFTAVARSEGRRAGQLIVDRAVYTSMEPTQEQKAGFIEGMDKIVSVVDNDSFMLERIHIGSVLQDVLSLVYKYQIPLDPNFGTLVLSIIIAEGILRQLDGKLDIFKLAFPFLLKMDNGYKRAAIKAVIG